MDNRVREWTDCDEIASKIWKIKSLFFFSRASGTSRLSEALMKEETGLEGDQGCQEIITADIETGGVACAGKERESSKC